MTEQAKGNGARSGSVTVNVQRSATDKTIVHVSGELLGDAAAKLRRIVSNELMRPPSLLALDLSDVTRIDSAGIDALVSAATQAGEADISFCLVGVQAGPVATALADAELTELFEIVPDISVT
jgi:anti-sigma B factor antagonist